MMGKLVHRKRSRRRVLRVRLGREELLVRLGTSLLVLRRRQLGLSKRAQRPVWRLSLMMGLRERAQR